MLKRRDLLQIAAGSTILSHLGAGGTRADGLGTDYDVVVLGAGVAGLAAAERILSFDAELKVLVLEARDRIGGRVDSRHRDDVYRDAELGAQELKHPDGASWPVLEDLGLNTERLANDSLTLFPGMSALVNALAETSAGKVQLSSEVTEIFWREGLVGISYLNRGLKGAVTARRLIMALPAGVLRDSPPQITPGLGAQKLAALASLRQTDRVCACLLFPAHIASLADGDEQWVSDDQYLRLRAFRAGQQGELLLEAQFSGPKASALRGQDEALVSALALRAFAPALQSTPLVSDAVWSQVVDWQSEKFSRGGGTVKGSTSTHLTLAESIGKTLFFAGEATADPAMVDSVHGAYASGARAAREVAISLDVSLGEGDETSEEPLFELL